MLIQTAKGAFFIREALFSDLPELVNIHVASFNATYPNDEPKPTYQLRERQWRNAFEERWNNWFCFVAQVTNGPIAGFATGHNFNDPSLPYRGQLDKIHFLKPYQRLGLGSLLVAQVAQRFLQSGIDSMILFADPENPAVRFYDKLEGERLLNAQQQFTGAYGWKNLRTLTNLLRS